MGRPEGVHIMGEACTDVRIKDREGIGCHSCCHVLLEVRSLLRAEFCIHLRDQCYIISLRNQDIGQKHVVMSAPGRSATSENWVRRRYGACQGMMRCTSRTRRREEYRRCVPLGRTRKMVLLPHAWADEWSEGQTRTGIGSSPEAV